MAMREVLEPPPRLCNSCFCRPPYEKSVARYKKESRDDICKMCERPFTPINWYARYNEIRKTVICNFCSDLGGFCELCIEVCPEPQMNSSRVHVGDPIAHGPSKCPLKDLPNYACGACGTSKVTYYGSARAQSTKGGKLHSKGGRRQIIYPLQVSAGDGTIGQRGIYPLGAVERDGSTGQLPPQ